MAGNPRMAMNDGHFIPQLGFGTWRIQNGDAAAVIGQALGAGYRAIDTAAAYGNEAGIGTALAEARAAGTAVFLTTKLGNAQHGREAALAAAAESLGKLRVEAADLYLIHWPIPRQDRYVETWRALIDLRARGEVRSIGVSNFAVDHLRRLMDETGVVPAVNQIELHPHFQQRALRAFHETHGIVTQSWSPLGRGRTLADPTIARIAEKHGRTPAQIVLRWHIESGLNVIPKSATPARISQNVRIFDFTLDWEDMARIAELDSDDGRTGPDPATFG